MLAALVVLTSALMGYIAGLVVVKGCFHTVETCFKETMDELQDALDEYGNAVDGLSDATKKFMEDIAAENKSKELSAFVDALIKTTITKAPSDGRTAWQGSVK